MSIRSSAVLLAFLLAPAAVAAQAGTGHALHEVDTRAVNWAAIDVPGFAPGLQIAVLAGNPEVADQPYTLRLRFPDGYNFPAHWHPVTENLTVISGAFYLAMGNSASEGSLKRYIPGDFLMIPARMSHHGGVRGDTVIQLHGLGPFAINLTATSAP